MKKVFSNSRMVAHVFAQQNQSEGRTSSGNMYFEGSVLYSYGSHFPLAVFLDDKTVLLNKTNYSVTTSKHQAQVQGAVSHYTRLRTTTSIIKTIAESVRYGNGKINKKLLVDTIHDKLSRVIVAQAESVAKRRLATKKNDDIQVANDAYENAAELLAFYKIAMPAKTTKLLETLRNDHAGVIAANQKQIAAAERKRVKEAQRKKAKDEKLAAAAIIKWRKGEELEPEERHAMRFTYTPVALRVIKRAHVTGQDIQYIETSQGAEFPVKHALKAWPAIRACKVDRKEWQANGHTIHLGNFSIDRIEADGKVIAGCHVVQFSEVEAIAKQLGLA